MPKVKQNKMARRYYKADEVRHILLQDSGSSESDNDSDCDSESTDNEGIEISDLRREQVGVDNDDDTGSGSEQVSDSDSEQESIEPLPPKRGRAIRGTSSRSRGRGRSTSVSAVPRKQDVRAAHEQQFVAKSGKVWSSNPPPTRKRSAQNIVRSPPGLKNQATFGSVQEAFHLIITPDILTKILEFSNQKLKKVVEDWNSKHENNKRAYEPYTMEHLHAFLGLLILRGVLRGNHEKVQDLWKNDQFSRPIFKAVMSRTMFLELLRIVSFDEKATRDERRVYDKLTAVRDMWEAFNKRLSAMWEPSSHVTIDEQLITFRGRVTFRIYNKSKPGRYGMLIRWICDSSYRYAVKGIPYCGVPAVGTSEAKEMNKSNNIVRQLVEPIKGSGRGVTCDRFYTDIELAEDLYRNFNLTMTGTMQSNRRHIPEAIKDVKNREPKSSVFCFSDNCTMVSYCPKKNRNVIMASTEHHDAAISDEDHKKPEIIMHYNATKFGVDTVDQMARTYSTKMSTRRWTLAFFCNMIDVAAINAFTMFCEKFKDWNLNKVRLTYKMTFFIIKSRFTA